MEDEQIFVCFNSNLNIWQPFKCKYWPQWRKIDATNKKMFGFKFSVQAWFISCQLDKKCLWSFAHTYFFEFIKMNPNKQVNYYDTPWSFRNGLFNYNYYLISHASLHQNINGKLFFEGAESHVFTVCILEPSSSKLVPNSYIELTLIDCSEHVYGKTKA